MREGTSKVIHRADYQPPAFWIDSVELCFDLDPAKTRVLNRMRVRRNPDVVPQPLRRSTSSPPSRRRSASAPRHALSGLPRPRSGD